MTDFPAFYLNENIPVRIVPLLSSKGIKAVHTLSVGNQGFSDEAQLEYASANKYVLVTHNRRHFRGLHNRWMRDQKSHSGIIVIRCDEPENLVSRIEAFCNHTYSNLNIPFCVAPPFVVPSSNDTE